MRFLKLSLYTYLTRLWCMVIMFGFSSVWGQTNIDSTSLYKLEISKDLPLEKVMLQQESLFFSANRKLDSLKHIALDISVISKERLKQTGVNNLPEALQLLPQFVVKTKTNGLYSVEYRGAKGTNHSTTQSSGYENLLLLMNAVPLNDALSGEIWWEAVPVAIEDIERIEVIHSPQGTWYGYGGALGVINVITKQSDPTSGTQLNINLQTGQFQSHHYQGSLNVGINEKISVRIGANYQARERFQDAYFIRSASRYVSSDSLLFFQPEAFQTHLYTGLSFQSSGFYINSAYQWNDSIRITVDLGNQSTQAQSLFSPSEEIVFTTRESQKRWVNMHFSSPSWKAHVFHQSGNQDYAKGYLGLQYRTARTGARLEYHKALGRYHLLFGTEGINDQYTPRNMVSGTPLFEGAMPSGQWSQLLLSLYLQQTATFLKNKLYLESGQKLYQNLQAQDYPLGYHLALKWFFTESISIQLSAAQVVQNAPQLFVTASSGEMVKTANYAAGIQKQLSNKGMLKGTLFNQQQIRNDIDLQVLPNMPAWGSTWEAWYRISRWKVGGHATRFFDDAFSDYPQAYQYPAWVASIHGNFSTFFDKVNLNAGLFYYSEHSERIDSISYQVPVQWLIHAKCSYRLWNQHLLYVNVKNLMNEEAIVIPFADQNRRLIMLGLNIVL